MWHFAITIVLDKVVFTSHPVSFCEGMSVSRIMEYTSLFDKSVIQMIVCVLCDYHSTEKKIQNNIK